MFCRRKVLAMRKVFLVFLLVGLSTIGLQAEVEDEQTLEFNSEYALRKSSNTVKVYYTNERGEKIEYSFDSFNADVVLYVYRHIEQDRMVDLLSSKYRLSKTEARRKVKMAINTMEVWNIVLRT